MNREIDDMIEQRNRILQNTPATLAPLRKTLKAVAECVISLESADFIAELIKELEMLQRRDTRSIAWKQTTSRMKGPDAYSLEKFHLYPDN